MRGSAYAAVLSGTLMGMIVSACREYPTAPPSAQPSTEARLRPSFSFTGGSGKLLGSTNQGELVEIDLDAHTVALIGDVGTVGGDELGWTDIAGDDAG